jgi:hypothetical protein
MSPLSRPTILAVLTGFALAVLPQAPAQNAFSPGGNDYPILGAVPGDQVRAQAAISTSGGWVVWQDNAVDTNGLGVGAWRLDAALRATGPKVRVNATQVGDQEKPQVAKLTGGNTVFVWQGGKQGFQKIYTRFVAPNGSFLTSTDVLVNTTYTNNFQIDPAVAALNDGRAVVIWSSYDQDGSRQGVYGRIYNANGTTNGGVFQVNQFSLNNQRTPSVAALSDGGFAVAWVSELQRGQSSVDIFCRRFNASGSPASGEFPVNTSTTNACANPSLAALPAGGFAVAWSQRDFASANSSLSSFDTTVSSGVNLNSWDVWMRAYGATGLALGLPVRMNSYTYGDQYAPKLSAFGRSYLACWQSLGQDGVLEGVFGQFMSASGELAGVEFRINSDVGSRQLFPAIAADGNARFLTIWSSYATSGNVDLFGRVFDLIQVSIAPISGGVRVSWNSRPGMTYQLQASADMANWSNYGAARVAVGDSDYVDIPAGATVVSYRVVRIVN